VVGSGFSRSVFLQTRGKGDGGRSPSPTREQGDKLMEKNVVLHTRLYRTCCTSENRENEKQESLSPKQLI